MTPLAFAAADNERAFAVVRACFSDLREAEEQGIKSSRRAVDASRIAAAAQAAIGARRLELGRALLRARQAWPERGPRARGWGEFLKCEGIHEQSAREWMALADFQAAGDGLDIATKRQVAEAKKAARAGASSSALRLVRDPAQLGLRLGNHLEVLADVGIVDNVIADPPYSARVHASRPTRSDGVDADGLAPNYPPWAPVDVEGFVEHWSPRCRGWMLAMCDDELIPIYRAAYERAGRFAFAPVPCVIKGMTVRTRGDGPSSWAVYAMVARPRTELFAKWGTLPGAYVGSTEAGAEHGRGKPAWLMEQIISDYTRAGDLVCDPLAGYGSTLLAALKLGRRAVGAEIDAAAVVEAQRRFLSSNGAST